MEHVQAPPREKNEQLVGGSGQSEIRGMYEQESGRCLRDPPQEARPTGYRCMDVSMGRSEQKANKKSRWYEQKTRRSTTTGSTPKIATSAITQESNLAFLGEHAWRPPKTTTTRLPRKSGQRSNKPVYQTQTGSAHHIA